MKSKPEPCPTPRCVASRWHSGACVDSALRYLRPAPGTTEGIKLDLAASSVPNETP